MSPFCELSKKIGYWHTAVSIPHPDVARELLSLVRDEKNIGAFEKVLLVYRYAPNAVTSEDQQAINLICEAFNAGTVIFR
jgi:hypothetical protein